MNIRINIYDFFAYTAPGGLYVLLVVYFLSKQQVINWGNWELSVVHLIIAVAAAYILGVIGDEIKTKTWLRLFRRRGLYQATMEEFSSRNAHVKVDWAKMDWFILVSYIRKTNYEMAADVEHLNVSSIMYRNVSFALLLFSIVSTVEFISGNYSIYLIITFIVFLTSSVIMVKRAVELQKWFFQAIFQSIIAISMSEKDLPVSVLSSGNTKLSK